MTYPTMDELISRAVENLADSIAFNYKEMGEQWAMDYAKRSSTLGWKTWNNALHLAEVNLLVKYGMNVSLAQYNRTSK
jgi:hypothetical protein